MQKIERRSEQGYRQSHNPAGVLSRVYILLKKSILLRIHGEFISKLGLQRQHRNKNLITYFFWFSICCCFPLLSCTPSAFAQTKVPLLFGENKNEKGELIPIDARFTKLFSFIEKDLDIRFELRMYPWNRAVKLASDGDGLIFGMSLTPERAAVFDLSEPAMYRYLWLVTRSDRQFTFNKLEDLKGKTIGVVRGSKYGGEFDTKKGHLFETDDDIDAYGPRLKKLLTLRIDAMIFSSPLTEAKEVEQQVNAIKLYKEAPLETSQKDQVYFSVLPIPILKDGIRFASLQGSNAVLIRRINKSLEKFHAREAAQHRKKQKPAK